MARANGSPTFADLAFDIDPNVRRDGFWEDDEYLNFGKLNGESDQSYGQVGRDSSAGVFKIAATKDGAGSFEPVAIFTSDVERSRWSAAGELIHGVGEGGNTAATGNTLRAPDIITAGGGGNIAGADIAIAAGIGTGTGDAGIIDFQLPIEVGAGNIIQTRASRLTLDMVSSGTVLTMAAAQAMTVSVAAGNLTLATAANTDNVVVLPGRFLHGSTSENAFHYILQPGEASGAPVPAFRIDVGAHTGITAAETSDVTMPTTANMQFTAGGAIALQRTINLSASRSYSATGAQTITEAAHLAIGRGAVAEANITIGTVYGILVQTGPVAGAGTVTTAYGLFSNAPTGATTNWAGGFGGNVLVDKDVDGLTELRIQNVNAGTLAQAILSFANGDPAGDRTASIAATGTGHTPVAVWDRQDCLAIQSSTVTVGGISIAATAATGIITFHTGGNAETAQFTANGELLVNRTSLFSAGSMAEFGENANASPQVAIVNETNGNSATASLGIYCGTANSGTAARVELMSTAAALNPVSGIGADQALVRALNASGGLNFLTGDATPIIFTTNTTEKARVLAAGGFRITGTTAQAFLELDNGVTAAVSIAGEARMRYNDTVKELQRSVNGGAYVSLMVFPEFQLFADQLENPNSADWTVNALAPAEADDNNAGLTVRAFDDTAEEGVGFTIDIPSGATNMIVSLRGRARTAPGAARTVGIKLYNRGVPNNAAVQAWSAAKQFSDLDITTNEFFQYDTEATFSLASVTVTAGESTQFELTRDPTPVGGTNLVGDYLLHYLKISFS